MSRWPPPGGRDNGSVGERRNPALWLVFGLIVSLLLNQACFLLPRGQVAATTTNATLTLLRGVTLIARAGESGQQPASDGMVLQIGDRVSTRDNANALLTFFEGTTVELEPNTTLVVDAIRTDQPTLDAQLSQSAGTTWTRVVALADVKPRFTLDTPQATIGVRGTLFETSIQPDPRGGVTTRVGAYEGLIEVAARGISVTVNAGNFTQIRDGETPRAPRPLPPPNGRLRLAVHSPAWLVVVDPDDRSVGVTPPGETVNQIPQSNAVDQTVHPQSVTIDNPAAGDYQLYLFGKADGAYLLTLEAEAGGRRVTETRQIGQVRAGDRLVASVRVSGQDGRITSAELTPPRPLTGEPAGKRPVPAAAAERAAATATVVASSATPTPAATAAIGSPTTAPPATPEPAAGSPEGGAATADGEAAATAPAGPTPVAQPIATAAPTPAAGAPTAAPPAATPVPTEAQPTPRIVFTAVIDETGFGPSPTPRVVFTVVIPDESTPVPTLPPPSTSTPVPPTPEPAPTQAPANPDPGPAPAPTQPPQPVEPTPIVIPATPVPQPTTPVEPTPIVIPATPGSPQRRPETGS